MKHTIRNKRGGLFFASRRLPWFGLALACAWIVTQTAYAKPGEYDGPRWLFLDAARVMAAAGQITTNQYPDCDSATVDKKMVRVYRADGTGEAQDETFTKVLTEKGKRQNRDLSQFFMLPYFTVEVVKLEVIKPSGEHLNVDIAANSKEMIDDSQMGMNIYDPNMKILKVNIPQLDPGDVVHSVVRTTTHRAIIAGEFSDSNVFEDTGYIRHISYEIYEPADKPLKRIVVRDEVAGTLKHSTLKQDGDITLQRWEVTNVPRMFEESGMPPRSEVLQRVLVSTTPTWQDVSKWYYNVCRPHLDATTPEMKKKVEDLTAGVQGDLERVKAVFYEVAQKIRYMGITPEKDRPGFEPHDVKLTFDNKYGVCRDKAALLVSLLEAAGFKTYPVLINVGTKLDSEVPSPDFNHAIVAVELKPAEYTLMDPTAENTKELLPSYECDQSYLICRPEGEILKTSPIIPAEENLLTVQTTASLDVAGNIQAKSTLSFGGINDNAYRGAFARMKPDDKRRFFERTLKRSMAGARLVSLNVLPEDAMDVSVPLHAELEFTVTGTTAAGNGKAVVSLPWISRGMGVVNFVLEGTGLDKRKYPLRTSIACGVSEHLTVKLGEGYSGKISIPTFAPINNPSLGYQRQVELAGNALDCTSEFKLKTVQFSTAEYLELKRSLKALDYDRRKAPVLAVSAVALAKNDPEPKAAPKATVESNARVVESQKRLTISGPAAAVLHGKYLKEVLTYSGKKSEAEVKFNYNPACGDAKIVSAAVTSKTGTRQEITPKEINIMDAGWNASAKRYTGGKVLVANLPGVDIGSKIEVEYELTYTNRPFISGFEPFQAFDDVVRKEYRLDTPADLKVQTVMTGPAGIVQAASSEADKCRTYTWKASNVPALPAESQLPPEWTFLPGVDYFAGDLAAYLGELKHVMLERSGQGPKAAQLAKRLVAEAKGQKAGLRAIRDYVARNIRSAGPSFLELPLSELSAADTTLSDGYGHAADRAILLHSMLKAAGYSPEIVLASGLPPIGGITNLVMSFPLPQNFQLPLVRVTLEGIPYYLNNTDQYAELGTTPSDGHLALSLETKGFEIIQAADNFRDKTETDYSMALSDSGKTRLAITHRYYGTAFNGKKRYFSELPPEERKRYFQELVSDVAQGAQPVSELVTRFDSYPGTEEFAVEVDHYCVVDGKYSYLDLPYSPSLFPVGADTRSLPLFLSQRNQFTVRTRIDLPANFRNIAIAPPSESLEAPEGAGKVRVTSTEEDKGRLIVQDLVSSPAIIPAEEYPAMLKLEASLGRKAAKTLLLEASPATLP